MFLIKYILSCYSSLVNETSFTEIAYKTVMKESKQVPFKTEDKTPQLGKQDLNKLLLRII